MSETVGKVTVEQVNQYKRLRSQFMREAEYFTRKGDITVEEAWKKFSDAHGLSRFAKLPESPDARSKIVQDFRGSRFDIMQNFAEGFDPDRIAVAFANDLSNLGERRLQSGLAPIFAAR